MKNYKNYAVEIKVSKNYYNEPDYDFWDSWRQILRKKLLKWLLIITRKH